MRTVIDLGVMALTGVFPAVGDEPAPATPLVVCRCGSCHTSQLRHDYTLTELFGPTYGYRSGLNKSMRDHLRSKAGELRWMNPGDLVVDIGSNDGFFLSQFPEQQRIGVDPLLGQLGTNFAGSPYYTGCIAVPAFFDAQTVLAASGGKKAKLVTSIAMFYDVPDPVKFAKDVRSLLTDDGVWHLEVSYWPGLLRMNAFDTVCQEHIFYYSLTSLMRILAEADLYVEEIGFNYTNGSSVALDIVKTPVTPPDGLGAMVALETADAGRAEARLAERLPSMRVTMRALLEQIAADGGKVLGLGASTKGNVLLQYFGLDLEAIGEVNADKFGRVTPGTKIPIISEEKALQMNPSHLLVLPWHFRQNLIDRMHNYLEDGGKLIFPLPFQQVYAHD